MKIKSIDLFHTPKDWDYLTSWINGHSSDERAHLIVAAVMGWNLACKLSTTEEEKK